MPLSPKHVRQLQRLIKAFEGILADAKSGPAKRASTPAAGRQRRTGKELIAFRKNLAAERRGGMSVADLATKYGVSTAYIYQLPTTSAAKAKTGGEKRASKKAPVKKSKRKASASGATSDAVETAA